MAGAAAAARAPEPKKTGAQQAKAGQSPEKAAVSRPMGIGIMVVLLCLSLVAGNWRALQKATPPSFLRQGEVASVLKNRDTAAANVLTVARRADLDPTFYSAVEDARKALSAAKTARAVSGADQQLMAAVGDAAGSAMGLLSASDQKLITGEMDTFNDEGNILRQEARAYNEKAEKAKKVYDGLLLKALFAAPDVYEGL